MKALFTGSPDGSWLRVIPGPVEFRNLIESMMDLDIAKRPTARQIYLTLEGLLRAAERPVIATPNISWGTLAKLAIGTLAVVALTNTNKRDDNVERYRNSKGEFASGLW
jgi:hypothetical protein